MVNDTEVLMNEILLDRFFFPSHTFTYLDWIWILLWILVVDGDSVRYVSPSVVVKRKIKVYIIYWDAKVPDIICDGLRAFPPSNFEL